MKNIKLNLLLVLSIVFFFISCEKDKEIAPAVTIGYLQHNMEILKGSQIKFPVHASDEDGTISSVVLFIDGVEYETALTSPYIFTWSTLDETVESHTIKAIATDNESLSTAYEISVKVITASDPVIACPEAIMISYQGQTYTTVKIGEQCWLKENLNVTTDNSVYYDDDPDNGDTYGQLYTWDEANTVCPPGWHLPTHADWCDLVQYVDQTADCIDDSEVGSDGGFKLKTANGWMDDYNGSNQYGFSALPGGFKMSSGDYTEKGLEAAFWTSSPDIDDFAFYWSINNETARIKNSKTAKADVLSVRCLLD